jgi:hypothetical protein
MAEGGMNYSLCPDWAQVNSHFTKNFLLILILTITNRSYSSRLLHHVWTTARCARRQGSLTPQLPRHPPSALPPPPVVRSSLRHRSAAITSSNANAGASPRRPHMFHVDVGAPPCRPHLFRIDAGRPHHRRTTRTPPSTIRRCPDSAMGNNSKSNICAC